MHASDIELHNPIVSHRVDPNRIVKDHGYAEQARGLPPGSLADEAYLTVADPQRICFALVLRELAPIELSQVTAILSAPDKGEIDQPQLWPDGSTVQTYDGLVPEQRETGVETVCTSRASDGTCVTWSSRPTYATVYVRGPVQVYQTRGKLCYGNSLLTSATQQLSLDVRLPAAGSTGVAVVGFGWGAMGGGQKRAVFRWGFGGK